MTARLRTTPRKAPRQERARDTVDVLLAATARTLLRVGYDRASTNRIALEAGVSIGSLYQYYPNKEALVAALIDRHTDEMAVLCQGALGRAASLPLAEAAAETVQAMVAAHSVNPRLHKLLQEQVPRVGKLKRIDQLHEEATAMVRLLLESRRTEVVPPDLELAAFFVVETVDSLIHAALGKRHGQWDENRLIEEITRVVLSYLTGKAAAAASS